MLVTFVIFVVFVVFVMLGTVMLGTVMLLNVIKLIVTAPMLLLLFKGVTNADNSAP